MSFHRSRTLKEVDIYLALKRPGPDIRFLSVWEALEGIQEDIKKISKEMELEQFVSLKRGNRIESGNPNEFIEFIVSLDWISMFKVLDAVSSLITIGHFIYRVINRLRSWRDKNFVRGIKINCTASISAAILHLRNIGAQINQSQLRLLYLSKKLGWFYVSVFSSPLNNPLELHILVVNIEGHIMDYQYIRL